MAEDARQEVKEPDDDGSSTPNSAKRRKLMPPARAGLNWNQGSKPAIRTSLGRSVASAPAVDVPDVAKDDSSPSSGSASPVGATDLVNGRGNGSGSGAPRGPSLVADTRAQQEGDAAESSSESSSESGDDAPPAGKPRGSTAPSVIGSSQIDLENDELYGGTGGDASAPASKATNGAEVHSDDDSDILQLHTDDELDRGVMINVSDSRAIELPMPESVVATTAPSQSPPVPHRPQKTASTAELQRSSEEGEIHDADVSAPPASPPTLADLSTADLRLQVRYFYIGRDLATIPLSEFARCLHCACTGHLTAACPSQTCRYCSSTEHMSTFCPQVNPCSKCLAKGHTEDACPEKLRAVPTLSSYTCPRCSNTGHLSSTCELLWRSSGTAYIDLPSDLAAFRRECYECGQSAHLGNDCDSRMPGKPLGSSSWSGRAATAPPVPPAKPTAPRAMRADVNKKKAGPKKRGLPPPPPGLPPIPPPTGPAQRGKPKAGRGGAIQIRGISSRGTSNRPLALQPQNAPPPQAPSGPQGKRGRGGKKRGPGRGGGGGGGGRGGGGGDGNWSAGRRGGGSSSGGGGDAYRPMPSSASKAWSRGFQ